MDSRRRITNTKSAEESSFLSEPSKELTPPKGRPDWRLTYTFVDWAPYIDSDFHVVNKGETHLVRRIRSWTPSLTTALKLLIAFRLIPAVWLHITDCDETYNYWDPLHYLLYGSGFETWEYSPTYAIRSYAYLLIHALPLRLFQFISGINRDHLFFLLRTILSASCALCELYFYNGVRQKFGNSAARVVLLIQLFAPGMFIAAPAFLPSSFALCCSLVSLGALFHRHRFIAVAATAVGALLGWPFAAITGVPVALELVRTGRLRYLIAYALLSGGVCGAAILLVDSYYYGRVAFPPLSIVLYNVFSSQHGGSELYGVEPWTYYIFNLILNYNVAALLSIAFLLLLIPAAFILRWPFMLFVDMISILSGFLLWLLIFFMQPHKVRCWICLIKNFRIFNLENNVFPLGGTVSVSNISSHCILCVFGAPYF
jgi:alpha-1,2-mannosyltransferase